MSKFKDLANEYLRNLPETPGDSEKTLRDTLVSLERDEDLESRGTVGDQTLSAPAAEMDEGAAPNIPSQQQLQEKLLDLADEDSIVREQRDPAPEPEGAPPDLSGSIKLLPHTLGEDMPEDGGKVNLPDINWFDPNEGPKPDDRKNDIFLASEARDPGSSFDLEKEADIKVDEFQGLSETTIIPKDADFDAEAMIKELDQRVVPVPEYASPELGGLPELDPLPDVNDFIRDVGMASMFEAGGRVMEWERR